MQPSLPLIAKHRRWETFLGEAERAAAAADWSRCTGMVARFVEVLWQRIGAEERMMVPAILRSGVHPTRTIAALRRRHGQLAGTLRDMHAALGAQDADVFITSCERLILLLRRHMARAERLAYAVGPVVDGQPLIV
ncbi:MAG: hemerythrin domain-containing protein [Burkholderiales bacterium]|nr:hemerythrin domain-containing protein [Burkholderiales bacterium]